MGFFSSIWKSVTKPFKKLMSWLVPAPDSPAAQAVTVEKQGSDHAIPVVYGTRRIGGIKVHKYVTDASGGAANEYLHLIIVFCEGPIEAISELYFDGVAETDARWNKSSGGKWFTVQRCLGTDNQAALSTGIPNWTSDHKLLGLAYIHLRLQMDQDQKIWRGEPEVTALIKGRKILDPRTGQTVYSENLPLQLLDYLSNARYGKGMPPHRINQSSFIEDANWADEQLTSDVTINGVTSAVTHARITGNLVVDTSKSVFSNVKLMLSGMRGMLPIGSGQLRLMAEKEGSPQFYFGHDGSNSGNFALITSPIKSKAGRKSDRYNRVIIRFPNKLSNFENDEVYFPASTDPVFTEWLAEDNGVLLEQSFEFETITNKAEAYQMAEIVAKRSRNRMEVSFTASPPAIVVEPGDIVGITDDTRGWNEKPFRVELCKLREDGDVEFEFIEHQNAIYPWSGVAYSERVGGTNLGDPTNIAAPTGLQITLDPTFSTSGLLQWNSVNNAFIRRFDVAVYSGSLLIFRTETLSTNWSIPLMAPGSYQIQIRAVSSIGFLSPSSSITFELTQPVMPTDIIFTAGNFEIEARPVLFDAGLGTEFEFAINSVNVVRGRGVSLVFTGLSHSTEYTVYARTVNAMGRSAWFSKIATTTANATDIIDLIGEDLVGQLTPIVVGQVETQLQSMLDSAVEQIPTVAEIQEVIDGALAEVDLGLAEDGRLQIVEQVNSVFDNAKTLKQVVRVEKETQSSLSQANGEINTLKNETLPAVNQAIDKLNNETLPAVNQAIEKLNNETLPNVKQDILSIQGLFPIQSVSVATNAITETKISDGAISTPKIATNAITANKIAAGAIITEKMQANSISGDRIAVNTLAASKIISLSITGDKIAANSISADKIIANSVTADKLASNSVSTDKLVANSVTSDKLTANSVSADKIVANSVTADKLAANSVTAEKIAASSVTADKLTANSVTAAKVSANAIESEAIKAGAVLADKIAAGAITADKIAANAITSIKVDAGAITAEKVAAGAITASKISAGAIEADKIAANAITAGKIEANALNGKVITGTILRTDLPTSTKARVVIGDTLPIWYGVGDVSTANASFYVNGTGVAYANNIVIGGNSVFQGDLYNYANIIGGTFKTANSGYRAEMSGSGFPFWYGTGAKSAENGLFYVDAAGNVVSKNMEMRDGMVKLIGANHMKIIRATPFGSANQFYEWFGPKNSSTYHYADQQPNLSTLTYANAIWYLDVNGRYPLPVQSNAASGSSNYLQVSHFTQGNRITITGNVNISFSGEFYSTNREPNVQAFKISVTVKILSWGFVLKQVTLPITLICQPMSYEPELGTLYSYIGSGSTTVTATDIWSAGSTVLYTLDLRTQSGMPSLPQLFQSWDTSIQTIEVKQY